MHSEPTVQDCPFCFLQFPTPSHAWVPEQTGVELLSASPLITGEVQVPAGFMQLRHVVVQSVWQQTPSTQ
jgi:hypothetical protein